MKLTADKSLNDKAAHEFHIADSSIAAVAEMFKKTMTEQKYKLERGSDIEGVYGLGNAVMLMFLGAFAKRFEFSFSVKEQEGKVVLTLSKNKSASMMGGVIGMRKMGNEYDRLVELIKTSVK